ncbi:ATP-binding cassette domain-containing protein [Shimia sp. R9_1]|uniref:ABC transporter ATP-binding protein n=1 Tax=Shimia sp. R9_1 TaxID=2821111 RepID=UPI0032AF4EE4
MADLSLTLSAGETVAITGPSGIGKTSMLRILAGLETGFSGTVQRPERVAMVFQEPTLLPWRSLRDNLYLATGASAQKAEAKLIDVGLKGLGDRFPGQLSLGQQRRLSLARAFVADPQILLMDEPFVSLDEALAEEMMGLFEELRAGTDVATVLVTHVPKEAERLADRVLRLEGRPATFR